MPPPWPLRTEIVARARPTPADRFRAAREAFVLSCQLGVSPREAAVELDRRRAKARWRESTRRLAELEARAAARNPSPQSTPAPRPWWID